MAINFPTWVTDATAIPPAFLVRAKKLIYVFAACEKLRRLDNAGRKWVRGEALSQDEQDLIASEFPGQTEPPTEEQFRVWENEEGWWGRRNHETHVLRAVFRQSATVEQLNLVDLQGLVD